MEKETITMDMICLLDLVSNAIAYGNNDLEYNGYCEMHYKELSMDFITKQLEVGNIPEFKTEPKP